MHTEKFKVGKCGLLKEADRSMYKDKDTVSKSLINHEKSSLNYNLCTHAQYDQRSIRARIEAVTGKKMRKDAVAFGGTIITLPQELQKAFRGLSDNDRQRKTFLFFQAAYEGLKELYGLKEEDVVSSYVHLDETTPHMHFYFLPHKYEVHKDLETEKETVTEYMAWDRVIPRSMYQQQHRKLEKLLRQDDTLRRNGIAEYVHLLNGQTLQYNPQKLAKKAKKVLLLLDQAEKAMKGVLTPLETLEECRKCVEGMKPSRERDDVLKRFKEIERTLLKDRDNIRLAKEVSRRNSEMLGLSEGQLRSLPDEEMER